MCKDGTCEAKVCNGNETCKTGSFSTSGDEDTITAWFSQIFGDNSNSNATPEETNNYEIENQEVSTPKAVNEETTSQSNGGYTYTVAGPTTPKKSSTNYFGTLAMSGNTESNETPADTTKPDVSTCENGSCATPTETSPTIVTSSSKESSTCTAYDTVYAALRADKTEKKIFSDSYTSLNFAQDVSTAMKAAGVGCDTVKVTFTDGSVNYLNSMKTCNGELLVDSCGTSLGTGIKKQVTVLEVGQQWTAKSLFGECTKTYTRGIVSSIE
ncbi:MAG: hypothetical protein M0P26_01060 [Bacteroidales bacterium]|nr:hypothetical protein [Bacteroidales bacterium]